MSKSAENERNPLKEKIHDIIFEADTRNGKLFDILLLIFILVSVFTVMLETVPSLGERYGTIFLIIEWILTIVFTIEYVLRLYSTYKPMKYALSAYGIIDLLSILPTYLSIFIAGSQSLVIIRALRLLRVFRVFKLGNHLWQAKLLMVSLKQSLPKITVFFLFVTVLVAIIGSIMYLIEGGTNVGFASIPQSMYWAIVTLTTVGYGDITPQTEIGQLLSAFVMMLGYVIIAVPTGIISVEMMSKVGKPEDTVSTQVCRYCNEDDHSYNAVYCKKCGEPLNHEEHH